MGFKPGFSILDQEDCRNLIKELLVRHTELDEKLIDTAQNTISNWKNSLLEPGQVVGAANSTGEQGIAMLYERYQRALKAYNAVDFDDLIMTPVMLFRQQTEVSSPNGKSASATYWWMNIRTPTWPSTSW